MSSGRGAEIGGETVVTHGGMRLAGLLGKDGKDQAIEWIAQSPARLLRAIMALQGRVNLSYQIH